MTGAHQVTNRTPVEHVDVRPSLLDEVIASTPKSALFDKIKDPTADAEKWGTWIHRSGMGGLANAEAGMVCALTCICHRIDPISFFRTYHIIQGKPAMKASAMLAEFRNRGGTHVPVSHTPELAAISLIDKEGVTYEGQFTWEEAQNSRWPWKDASDHSKGLKDNWSTPTDRRGMLWARLVRESIDVICPEITHGVYTPEEIEDLGLPTAEPKPKPTVEEATQRLRQQADPEAANDLQVARLEGLVRQLAMPEDKLAAALQKRGVSSLDRLSPSQADELIEKLLALAEQSKN